MRGLVLLSAFLVGVTGARADRALTEDEFARLFEALTETGCAGGKLEVEDGKFEVDGAICADGKNYDLTFDSAFQLSEKKLDD